MFYTSLAHNVEVSSSIKLKLFAANWYKYHLRLVDPAFSPCHDYCTSSISCSVTLTSTNGTSYSSLLSLFPLGATGSLSVLMDVWLSPVIILWEGTSNLSSVLVSLACFSFYLEATSFKDFLDPCTSRILSMYFLTSSDYFWMLRYLARVCT